MTYLLVMIEETQRKLQRISRSVWNDIRKTIECCKQLDTFLYLLKQALQNKHDYKRKLIFPFVVALF
ncbi:acetone carboxylase gamma subunit [Neobacillus niacini]|uniref:hypothetical protein n=1 Tax=Neobacillus driksii TaxID=3035913 RepID=UPI00278756AB|nr:hypothetical protein [Neobacillus niacini]MDQ0974596.1 acetone carboxylase gamma subunit [Neobacillus niacini]